MFRRWSLRTKITISVVAVLAIASLSLAKMAFGGISNTVQKLLGDKAIATVVAAEALVPKAFVMDPTESVLVHPEYPIVLKHLKKLQEESEVYAIRVVRYLDGRNAQFVVDTIPEDKPLFKGPGSVGNIENHPDLFTSGAGALPAEDAVAGLFMVSWRQVYSDSGAPVGSVLVYVEANEEARYLTTASLTLFLFALVLTVLGGYLSYKLGAAFEMTAITDGLTGLFNQKHFKQRLEFECHRAARYRVPLSIVMMDIDRFKQVNDTYGHAIGDLVLKNVAKWLKQGSRNTDLVARYGGEEMAVILPHTGLAGAQEFAERVRLKIANEVTRDQEEDVSLRVTVSLGVAQFEPGLSPMDLIKRADAALYQSKNNGRNRVTIWQDDLIPPLETKAEPAKVPAETR